MSTKGFKVLLGFDDSDVTQEMIELLSKHYHVELAQDSEEAYQKIHVMNPDLAILDYALSKIHPIELHEGIAMIHFNVRVIICVTPENLVVAQRIWRKRAIDFILKPFNPQRFMLDVNKVVRHIFDERYIRELKATIAALEEKIAILEQEHTS